jgi:cytochrome c556
VLPLLAILASAGVCLAVTAGEVVQTRRLLFDQMTEQLKYIANHWDDSANYGNLAQSAAVIARDARLLPKLFPAGTSQNDGLRTAAAAAIWTDRAGFDRLANLLGDQASGLSRTTAATPSDQVRSEVSDVIGTCKSCHRNYRN